MKTLIFKAVLMILIMVGISNYLMYIMTGKAPFSFGDMSLNMPEASISELKSHIPAGKEQAYKWTDANGTVHYSSEPPPENHAVELIHVDPNTNLVQGLRSEPKKVETQVNQVPATTLPTGSVYNPKTIKKLMDDAKGVQETLNKRYENLEKHSQ